MKLYTKEMFLTGAELAIQWMRNKIQGGDL